MTIKDVAKKLQVSERTVKRWIADKKLKTVNLPSRITRITEQALNDMMKEAE